MASRQKRGIVRGRPGRIWQLQITEKVHVVTGEQSETDVELVR